MIHITTSTLALCSGPLTLPDNYVAVLTDARWESIKTRAELSNSQLFSRKFIPTDRTQNEVVTNQLSSAMEAIQKIIDLTSGDLQDRLKNATKAIRSYQTRASLLSINMWAADYKLALGPIMTLDRLNSVLQNVQDKLDSTEYKLYKEDATSYSTQRQEVRRFMSEILNRLPISDEELNEITARNETLKHSEQELTAHAERIRQMWK